MSSDANDTIENHWVRLLKIAYVSHKTQLVSLGNRSKLVFEIL